MNQIFSQIPQIEEISWIISVLTEDLIKKPRLSRSQEGNFDRLTEYEF